MANYNYTVTVAYSSFYGQNVFLLDGTEKPGLNIPTGDTVVFDLSDASNATHPLGVGPTVDDESSAYGDTDGVTYTVNSVDYTTYAAFKAAYLSAKSSNSSVAASVTWTPIAANDASSFYFCGDHTGMGSTFRVIGGTDTDAPINGSIVINSGATSTTSTSVTLALSASDVGSVNGVFVSETNSTPAYNDPGWSAISATTSYSDNAFAFTLSAGVGTKTVYAWFKDTSDNISTPVSDTINLVSADTIYPYNTSISLAGGATSTTTQNITVNLAAQDDIGVNGYYLSESTTPPDPLTDFTAITPAVLNYSATVNFTLSAGDGRKTVYAWFKDAADNMSVIINDTIELATPDTTSPASATIDIEEGAASTATYEVDIAITGTDAVGITGFYLSETNSTPSANDFITVASTTSLSITVHFNLSAGDGVKTVYLWLRDAAGNISTPVNDTITSTADTAADTVSPVITAMSVLQSSPINGRTITIRLSGSDAGGVAGYYLSETITTPSVGQFTLFTGTDPTSFTEDIVFHLSSGSGVKPVYAWLLDEQGNISTLSSINITLASTGAGEADFKIRESILQSSLPGFAIAKTLPVNTNSLAFGPLQVSNTVTINGTFAVFNDLDIVENGIVNVVGTLDLR